MKIQDVSSYREFISRWDTEDCFVEFILSDHELHPRNNSLSLILVKFIRKGDTVVIPIRHNETLPLTSEMLLMMKSNFSSTKYVLDKKKSRHTFTLNGKVVDIRLQRYLLDGSITDTDEFLTNSHQQIYSLHYKHNNLNRSVPVLKWVEWFENVYNDVKPYIMVEEESNTFYDRQFISTLAEIEFSGIHVDRDKYPWNKKHIDKNGLVYTEYNPYTSTGRPSNRFGGVNFAALNKKDGSRDVFVSRFDRGKMVMFDYESYHPHLIANLMKYKLPQGDVYEWLGKQYYGKETLTEEDIDNAKKETFKQFYGGIHPELAENVSFFMRLDSFINRLWKIGSVKGFVISPISDRRIYLDMIQDINKQKLFNYFLQLYETEMNILVMNRLLHSMSKKNTKLVLYTYDAFLFDVDMQENSNNDVLTHIKDRLDPMGKFPLRCYMGDSYGDMNQINV